MKGNSSIMVNLDIPLLATLKEDMPLTDASGMMSCTENCKICQKFFTSSYFWVSASRSSSDMSGRRTAMVSYWRSPGGHWGSTLSSTAVKPVPGGEAGSSSETKPPSKNVPEKSSVWALTAVAEEVAAGFERKGLNLWENERGGDHEHGKRNFEQSGALREEEGGLSEELNEEEAMADKEQLGQIKMGHRLSGVDIRIRESELC